MDGRRGAPPSGEGGRGCPRSRDRRLPDAVGLEPAGCRYRRRRDRVARPGDRESVRHARGADDRHLQRGRLRHRPRESGRTSLSRRARPREPDLRRASLDRRVDGRRTRGETVNHIDHRGSASMSVLGSLLVDLPDPDEVSRAAVAQRAASVLRPTGALSRLDDVAAWLAAWQRTERPAVEDPHAGVGRPTGDLRFEPAMDARRFDEAVRFGVDAVRRADGADLLVFGEMGIGNTTAAAAVAATLYDEPAAAWCGRGTGLDDAGLARKIEAVDACRARVRARTADPIEILREAGGAELAAIAGAVVEARRRSIPVVLDGYVVTAAVAPLAVALPGALAHVIAGHRSAEPGHGRLLERLGLRALLELDLRLGEGTGALAAVPLVKVAAAAVVEVATFQEWGLA